MNRQAQPLEPEVIRRRYGIVAETVEPLGAGLINQTFLVTGTDGTRYVLQRLHEIFPAEVNDDIEAVTVHLAARAMSTPRLVRTVSGDLCLEAPDGIWRLMSYVPGVAVERVESATRAREAGRLLGRFHVALSDLDYDFRGARSGIHDTDRHLRNLENALEDHRRHRAYDRIRPLAESILAAAADCPRLPELPLRAVHGDPKISNFIFDPTTGRGVCIVDLDTLNRMPLPLELGDALRSWCNPAGEDTGKTAFSAAFFEAALAGYAVEAGGWISSAEAGALVGATLTIMVELAARFCADALNESYFGWDPNRFPDRSEHNRVRAQGQLAAWDACRSMEDALSGIVAKLFSRRGG